MSFSASCRNWGLAFIVGLLFLPALLVGLISQELVGADSLSLGTPFFFNIHSDKPISSVTIPDSVDGFAIAESAAQKGKSAQDWRLQIVPLKTGALSFPRLQVLSSSPDETDSTDAFRVHVLSTLAEGDTLLRDIKPMQRYHFQPPFWLYLLLTLLALLLGIMLLVKHLKARKRRKQKTLPVMPKPLPIIVPAKQIPAWQIALDELDALMAEALLEQGELIL
ncbi:MAG: hypothetical protein RBS43_06875, partial [Candidatus Cloacimonas sp.]|nr:hypothetical protein [Candidatus Cloacimonas sp.]